MSVEKEGAQGFDYQYVATLYMTLLYLDKEQLKVLVENGSFEDAQLEYIENGQTYRIELQIKKRTESISGEEFAGWLGHFQKRSSEVCILDEIEKSETNYFVIVTNSRCMDAVNPFVVDEHEVSENHVCFTRASIKELQEQIMKSINTKSDLSSARKEHIAKYFSKKNDEINKVLNRIFVIERKTQLEKEICSLLKERYGIPELECANVMNQMLMEVRKGRDSGENIANQIWLIINNKKYDRILPLDENFYKRDAIEDWIDELNKRNVLLLNGITFSGKTYAAKTIAQEFQNRGYQVKRTDDILNDREALYFLSAKENDMRLLLIEDPFGHVKCSENVVEIFDKIVGVLQERISLCRKVIITSRTDIVLEAFKETQLINCKLDNNIWHDTTIESLEEAKKIWENFYGNSTKSCQLFDKIKSYFRENGEGIFLEIGEISHLYLEERDVNVLANKPMDEVIKLARVSSEKICRMIESLGKQYRDIFILLGCFCNTIKSIQLNDLAYIMCSSEDSVSIRSGIEENVTIGMGRSERIDEKCEFPVYHENTKLNDDIMEVLRTLCEMGYIYRERMTEKFYFRHPIYAYASRLMFEKEHTSGWEYDKYIIYMRRAIGSLSKTAAVCCLKCMAREFGNQEIVIDFMIEASRSIFPVVRDTAILYLDQQFNNLKEEQQKEFMHNIHSSSVADRYIIWHGDECWYRMNGYHYRDFFEYGYLFGQDCQFSLDEIQYRTDLKLGFSKKEIYNILYSNIADELPVDFLKYALQQEEAIIRGKAIFYLFKNYVSKLNFDNNEYLHTFENYNVVYNMLYSMFQGIDSFDDAALDKLVAYFEKQFERKSVAMYVETLFDKFGDEYDSKAMDWRSCKDRKRAWKVWARLFSKWLMTFPVKFLSMQEAHMCFNVEQSLKYLKNEPEIVYITKAWLGWLHKYLSYHEADDYGMSVLDYLIEGTVDVPDLRRGILSGQLKEKNTNLITSHICHIVNQWEVLTCEEKSVVCNYLKTEKREDLKWIQAVALTRENVPPEIQQAITGQSFLDNNISQIIDILQKNSLLNECLHIFCGFPQPLWFNGYHHSGKYSLWDTIMITIVKTHSNDESFYIALREIMDALYNSESRFSNHYDVFKELLLDEKKRKLIFQRLAYMSATQNQDNKKMWDDLLKASTEEEKKYYFSVLCGFIEMIERQNIGYDGLLCEFDAKDVQKYLLPNLPADAKIIGFVLNMINDYEIVKSDPDKFVLTKIRMMYENVIQEFYTHNAARLLFTNSMVKMGCDKLEMKSEIIENLLKESKNDFWIRYEQVRESFENDCPLNICDEYKLKNWCMKC